MNFPKLLAFVRTFQQNKNKAITHRFRLIHLKTNQNIHCNFLQYFSIVLFPEMNWKLLVWSSPLGLLLKSPSPVKCQIVWYNFFFQFRGLSKHVDKLTQIYDLKQSRKGMCRWNNIQYSWVIFYLTLRTWEWLSVISSSPEKKEPVVKRVAQDHVTS